MAGRSPWTWRTWSAAALRPAVSTRSIPGGVIRAMWPQIWTPRACVGAGGPSPLRALLPSPPDLSSLVVVGPTSRGLAGETYIFFSLHFGGVSSLDAGVAALDGGSLLG